MSDCESLTSKTPLRPVDPDDVRRVWDLILQVSPAFWPDRATAGRAGDPRAPTMGIDVRLVAQHCSPSADVLAVFFRTALLQALIEQDMLNDWREGKEFRHSVFEAAATFPLPKGVESFDPNAFIDRLRSSIA
jgi:hypothetical protein